MDIPLLEKQFLTVKRPLSIADMEPIVKHEIGLASCTVMWKKNCFKTNRFNETLMYAEEWECYTRIISQGYSGVIIDNILYFNRKHPQSNTGEFYGKSGVRYESKARAILLIAQNLQNKKLLSISLQRYFIQLALQFKPYSLFSELIAIIKPPTFEKVKWQLFYFTLPLRLKLYKRWKRRKLSQDMAL